LLHILSLLLPSLAFLPSQALLIGYITALWQWRSKGGGKGAASGGTRPGAQALGAHQHTF